MVTTYETLDNCKKEAYSEEEVLFLSSSLSSVNNLYVYASSSFCKQSLRISVSVNNVYES
jgi:hypothetical protein